MAYNSSFVQELQKSKNARPRGLSLRCFENEDEMNSQISRVFEGPENRQAQFCGTCPMKIRQHCWPEDKQERKRLSRELSKKSFGYDSEMSLHVSRVYDGYDTGQMAYCNVCPIIEKSERNYKRKILRQLVTRPADTISSKLKDLFDKGAFYCNPTTEIQPKKPKRP